MPLKTKEEVDLALEVTVSLAAAPGISTDAQKGSVLSELDRNFALKEELRMVLKLFSVKMHWKKM